MEKRAQIQQLANKIHLLCRLSKNVGRMSKTNHDLHPHHQNAPRDPPLHLAELSPKSLEPPRLYIQPIILHDDHVDKLLSFLV